MLKDREEPFVSLRYDKVTLVALPFKPELSSGNKILAKGIKNPNLN